MLTAAVCVAVLAPAAATGTLDQQQTTVVQPALILGPDDTFGPNSVAQTFTPALSGGLDQVDLYLDRPFGPGGPLTVEVRNVSAGAPGSGDVGGAPGRTVLASASVPAAAVPIFGLAPATFVAVPFPSPASVLAGSQYAVAAYTGVADRYQWGGSVSDVYAGGATFVSAASPPTTWGMLMPAIDLTFKTYVLRDKAAVTTPCQGPGSAHNPNCDENGELRPPGKGLP